MFTRVLMAVALAAQAAPATVLKPGGSIEQPIAGAERHLFDLELKAGEYASLTVDQRGTDLTIRILDAAGATAVSVDDEMRKDEREHVGIVADDSRSYRIAIAARYPKLAPGRPYSVWVDAVRPATDRDRAEYRARQLMFEAGTQRTAGKLDDALASVTKALALGESALAPDGAFLATILNALAGVQRAKGQMADAERSFQRAIAIAEDRLGPEHPYTAALKETLGVMYGVNDDFAKAEPLMLEGTALQRRTLGDHPRVAVCLMDLALLHQRRGDEPRALEELQQAMQIADRTMSPDEFASIAIVNNLGDLYISMKQYEKARPYVERALRDLERTLGADNFRVATPLLNLGIIAREEGAYDQSLAYLRRSYAIREKTYGAEHTDPASVLITIGNLHHAQKDYPAALEHYQRAYDVLEKTAGPYHSYTLMAINNAARTYAAMGNLAAALRERARVESILDKVIAYNLAIGSDREKLAFLEQTFERMGRTISLHLRQMPDSAAAAHLAATAILHRKGRVLDVSLDSRASLRVRLDPGDRALLDRFAASTAQLSTLALSGPRRTPAAEYAKTLAALEAQHEALESQISRRSAAFRAEVPEPALASVRAALPPGAALIEFIVYQPYDPQAPTDEKAHGEPRYAAYVIRRGAETRGVDLGPAKTIDAAVSRLREALRDPARRDTTPLARALDQAVLRPVRAAVGAARQLLIAPDGALNLVPFEALVDERGRLQVQRYAIAYLGSGRELLRMRMPEPAAGAPLVLADPEFGEPAQAPGGAGRRASSGSASDGSVYFAPLDGTAREAEAIRRWLPSARVLTGSRASKAALMQAQAPSILHVASHAFFLANGPAPAGEPTAGTRAMTIKVQSDDPLLRSGIALAGANLAAGRDAGILTALEASTLNLRGTKLVTLSACDTGIGEVKNGEGVYGLRRAFSLAGAEAVVMTLWPVSDFVTRSVMTEYYAGLARGLGRGAALRRVQLAMLADPARRHPFYWAGFIQAGDWTPIQPGVR